MPVSGVPRVLLRLEGGVVLVGAILAYRAIDASWLVFVLLFLAPDLSIAAYLRGPRFGAVVYNAVHTYVAPALLAAVAATVASPDLLAVCIIWVGHIGLDRLSAFGLKYPTAFRDTHLA